jgi:hypothetical protein
MTRSRVGTSGSTSTASRQRRACCSGIPRSQHAGLSAGRAKHPLIAKPGSRAAAPRAGARERARRHDRAGSSSAATRRLVSRIPEMLLATAARTSAVTHRLLNGDAHVPRLTIAAMGRGRRSRWSANRRTVGPTIAFGRTNRIASSERPIPTRFLCHERDRPQPTGPDECKGDVGIVSIGPDWRRGSRPDSPEGAVPVHAAGPSPSTASSRAKLNRPYDRFPMRAARSLRHGSERRRRDATTLAMRE